MTKLEIYSRIVTWLYRNHEAHKSATERRQALVDMLEEELLDNASEVEFGAMEWTAEPTKKTKSK